MESEELSKLRAEIDALDEQLLTVLAARFDVTRRVGNLKALRGLSATDPAREAAQEQRLRARARQLGLNPDLAWKVMRLVIDEVVENHKQVKRGG